MLWYSKMFSKTFALTGNGGHNKNNSIVSGNESITKDLLSLSPLMHRYHPKTWQQVQPVCLWCLSTTFRGLEIDLPYSPQYESMCIISEFEYRPIPPGAAPASAHVSMGTWGSPCSTHVTSACAHLQGVWRGSHPVCQCSHTSSGGVGANSSCPTLPTSMQSQRTDLSSMLPPSLLALTCTHHLGSWRLAHPVCHCYDWHYCIPQGGSSFGLLTQLSLTMPRISPKVLQNCPSTSPIATTAITWASYIKAQRSSCPDLLPLVPTYTIWWPKEHQSYSTAATTEAWAPTHMVTPLLANFTIDFTNNSSLSNLGTWRHHWHWLQLKKSHMTTLLHSSRIKTKVPYSTNNIDISIGKRISLWKPRNKIGRNYQMHRYQYKDIINIKKWGNMTFPKQHNNFLATDSSGRKTSKMPEKTKLIILKKLSKITQIGNTNKS